MVSPRCSSPRTVTAPHGRLNAVIGSGAMFQNSVRKMRCSRITCQVRSHSGHTVRRRRQLEREALCVRANSSWVLQSLWLGLVWVSLAGQDMCIIWGSRMMAGEDPPWRDSIPHGDPSGSWLFTVRITFAIPYRDLGKGQDRTVAVAAGAAGRRQGCYFAVPNAFLTPGSMM